MQRYLLDAGRPVKAEPGQWEEQYGRSSDILHYEVSDGTAILTRFLGWDRAAAHEHESQLFEVMQLNREGPRSWRFGSYEEALDCHDELFHRLHDLEAA